MVRGAWCVVSEKEAAVASEEQRLLPADPVLRRLIEAHASARWSTSHGQDVVQLPREDLLAFARAARESGFEFLADVTAVDWLGQRTPRFEVVINLLSMEHARRRRSGPRRALRLERRSGRCCARTRT